MPISRTWGPVTARRVAEPPDRAPRPAVPQPLTPQSSAPDAMAGFGHVVLVGLPGSGKTSVGRLLASELGLSFLDFDEEIVRREGRSIVEIFSADGEPGFRALELALSREVVAWPAAVLAPGGGWVTQPASVNAIRGRAVLIHLRASIDTLIRRLGAASQLRPLLAASNPRAALERLQQERAGYYAAADFTVDTELLSPHEVARAIMRLIQRSAG